VHAEQKSTNQSRCGDCGGRHIALTYAWGGTSSVGDMAIAPGMVRLIKEADPEAKITVYTLSSGQDWEKARDYLLSCDPTLSVHPDPFSPLLGKRPDDELWWRLCYMALDPAGFLKECPPERRAAIADWLAADLRLFNCSMQFTYMKKGAGSRLKFWLPNLLAYRLRLPYALWGQSFGNIEAPGPEMMRLVFNDALAITGRDQDALHKLQAARVTRPLTGLVPDSSLFFEQRNESWAASFLMEYGLKADEYLLVLPRTFEFWSRRLESQALQERLSKLVAAVTAWVKETGLKVLFSYELPRETEETKQLILPLLAPEVREKCLLFEKQWTPEQAISVMARARAVLSMERYSVYLTMTAGTPVVHATSHEPSLQMDVLDRLGLADCHLKIDEIAGDALATAVLDLHHRHGHYADLIRKGREKLKAESVALMKELLSRLPAR